MLDRRLRELMIVRFPDGGDPPPFERIKPTDDQLRQYVDLEIRMDAKINEITNKAALDLQKVQMERLEGLGKIMGPKTR